MNKHWVLSLAVLAGLTACNRSTNLALRAVAEVGDEQIGRAQQIIQLLPYDRDEIFAMLASEAAESEPQPPEDLIALRDSVSAARQLWTDAESSWNDMRSEMQTLSEAMGRMNRSSREYADAYVRFDDLDAQVGRLDRAKNTYFETFTTLQDEYRARASSFNAVLEAWEDVAFERYVEITDSLIELRGAILEDTADAGGWTYFIVPRGTWYVHTRAKLVFEELYWNLAYESGGGADTLILNDSNADTRSIF
jgi:hypothetical protein